ncbi:TIR domain-containing protein [Mucilaginibacter sp. cycad4]|uniref:TIR domain-containing protein n=1 Tax=Mucilaginibacter sp. cycad4 TaxID=3342096 RepID=UPI002AAB6AB0|nr:TIR domain-containing protein [Mucilaginibacter gossypii]WPV00808.1 TIR domain-containing protein [Mucilaginibacter gossypii]
MADKKIIFIAFAIEDERQRDFLKGQSTLGHCPFEYIDLSVKEAYVTDWKEKVRTRIKKSHGVIVLVSKNSKDSSGQAWEIQCAKEERKQILAIWAYANDRTTIPGLSAKVWSWETIGNFIDNL